MPQKKSSSHRSPVSQSKRITSSSDDIFGSAAETFYGTIAEFSAFHRETVLKFIYVDIMKDLNAGLLLGQIVYWFSDDRRGRKRVRVNRNGRFWLVKTRADWFDEVRLTDQQVRRVLPMLVKKGIIDIEYHLFGGLRCTFIALNGRVLAKYAAEVKARYAQSMERAYTEDRKAQEEEENPPEYHFSDLFRYPEDEPEGPFRSGPKGRSGKAQESRSGGKHHPGTVETTAPGTVETTAPITSTTYINYKQTDSVSQLETRGGVPTVGTVVSQSVSVSSQKHGTLIVQEADKAVLDAVVALLDENTVPIKKSASKWATAMIKGYLSGSGEKFESVKLKMAELAAQVEAEKGHRAAQAEQVRQREEAELKRARDIAEAPERIAAMLADPKVRETGREYLIQLQRKAESETGAGRLATIGLATSLYKASIGGDDRAVQRVLKAIRGVLTPAAKT